MRFREAEGEGPKEGHKGGEVEREAGEEGEDGKDGGEREVGGIREATMQ